MKLKFFVLIFFLYLTYLPAKAEIVKPKYIRGASAETATQPIGVELSPDGTKVFFARFAAGQHMYQYTLDTPFDVSTIDASSEVILDLGAGSDDLTNGRLEGLTFNGDGTKVYAIDFGGKMNVHSLETPYDFSSFTQDADDGKTWTTYLSPNDGAIRPHDMRFNSDGSKMFLFEANADASAAVVEYHLATPYLPGSATTTKSFNVSSEINTVIQDIDFDDDGTRMYVVTSSGSNANHRLIVYKLSIGFDVTTAKHAGTLANFFSADETQGGTPAGIHFGNDGMKLYQADYKNNKIHEYNLICPYGIVICEEDTASNAGAQVDVAKQIINQNSSVIFKRFDWLRRNEGNNNLNTNNINLNINNPILSALSDTLKNTFNQKYTKASVKKKKETRSNFKNLSFWSHGDISIGRTGDKATTTPQTLKVGGLMFGVDKKFKNNKFVGAAIRYGQGNTYNKISNGLKLDSETLTLNLYSTNQLDNKLNLNTLLGLSFLKMDQLNSSDQVTGNRNGKQLFTAINMNSDSGYGEFNIRPTGGFMFGITTLSSYTDFSKTSVQDIYDSLVFNNGNITAGLKFDKLVEKTNFNLFRNGSIEYIQDLSSNIGYTVKSHNDLTSQRKSVKRHSLHNLKVNFGMESVTESGHTFGLNFERFQGLDESSHLQSLFFKFGYLRENNTDIAFNFDPLTSNTANLSYLKHYNYFDLKLDTNYSFMDENPGYGLNLQLSNTF